MMAGLHETMSQFHSYTPQYRQFPGEDAFPGQDPALLAPHACTYSNPALHHRVGKIQRQLPGEGSIKAYAPSSAPWTLDISPAEHPGAFPSVEAGAPVAHDLRSFPSDLSSASSVASPRSPNTYMYPAECYMTPPYDDAMLSQPGWDSPTPEFIPVGAPVVPLQEILYPDPKPIFEPQASMQFSPPSLASPVPIHPSPQPPALCETKHFAGGGGAAAAAGTRRTTRKRRSKYPASSPSSRSPDPKAKDKTKDRVKEKVKPGKGHGLKPPGRTFACTFRPYGCESSFSSKNEWKRHVASKHMQLSYYRCDVGPCGGDCQEANGVPKPRQRNYFNRKDLFTQHHRRMHAPWSSQNQAAVPTEHERKEFERSLAAVRARCLHEQRQPPVHSTCGFCGERFTGPGNWDQRMEHVGRHFERGDVLADAEREDPDLREWAIHQGILHENSIGEVKLV